MIKKKICAVVTARPSYSRIKTFLTSLNNSEDFELYLVLGASAVLEKYGDLTSIIEADGLEVYKKYYCVVEADGLISMPKTTGSAITELTNILFDLKPDAVVTIADRYETIATAITASYLNIPLIHIQGGEITGNIDEKVRHAITKLADIHLVSSEKAMERVIKMGEEPTTVFNTGCPSIDLARLIKDESFEIFDVFKEYGGVGKTFDLRKNEYIVVLQHPVTNEYHSSKNQIQELLDVIIKLDKPTLWFWPNVDAGTDGTSKGIREYREKYDLSNIHFFRNLKPLDFLRLINHCGCLVGNSSVGIRESSFLGVPVVNIGSRQAGRDRGGNVIDVAVNNEQILNAILKQLNKNLRFSENLFGNGFAGDKMVGAIRNCEFKFTKKLTYS